MDSPTRDRPADVPAHHQQAGAAIPITIGFRDPSDMLQRLAAPTPLATSPALDPALDPALPRWYALLLRSHALAAPATFDTLLAPSVLYDRVRPHPYQLRVVEQVLREKAPAAILADEVGLGKTIEAGLIYKELALRGLVSSVLVLAPKALLSQWQDELRERFDEDFVLTDEKRFSGFDREPRIICSLPQFVRSFDHIAIRSWDMVIVDEAHLLANPESKRRRCAGLLRARWRLLLTATPVANKVTDLYSLIDLVAPGKLGTRREFENEFVADAATCRIVRPDRLAELRAIVAQVSCRTRRADAEIPFAGRTVYTRDIAPTSAEDALISDVTNYLRALYRRLPAPARNQRGRTSAPAAERSGPRINRGAVIREIMALQQSLSSHPRAIEQSLRRRAESHADERDILLALADRCQTAASAKERLLHEVLADLKGEPALIFTLRLETAAHLREAIRARGSTAECYIGALSRLEREALVARFNAGEISALIATDAGAEGLNLQQRCHVVVNYDLHWNPMRIEQRIGRVHRLGQSRDVSVYNFALSDTIDDYVLRLLYQKINLFTMTVGALETVLSEVQEGELDLEERILDALLRADSPDAIRREVEALGDELVGADQRQHEAISFTERVLA
ncbi:MAG: helicase (Snf2/Rad54 family) [Ktedonobacterales bacterium]|nr:MAG: helicase (Snf2/Rad54 family) [Ktedonobacterales bacterium]